MIDEFMLVKGSGIHSNIFLLSIALCVTSLNSCYFITCKKFNCDNFQTIHEIMNCLKCAS